MIRSTTKSLCGICTRGFCNSIACEEHILGHFVIQSAVGYLCVVCAEGFKFHDECGGHILMHHSDIFAS